MKRVLILVVSSEVEPYGEMIKTSLNTWDSIEVEGVETIFYCGESSIPDTDKIKHFHVEEGLFTMGTKGLIAYEWALQNKEFDYVARVNSSCYVDKKKLLEYVQSLPSENVFAGVEADSQNGFRYLWGGMQFIISKDVLTKIVMHKGHWNHALMEDESMSLLVSKLGISFYAGMGCSINRTSNGWILLSYPDGNGSKAFTDFREIKDNPNHFYRVKQDLQRDLDKYVMNELFRLNS